MQVRDICTVDVVTIGVDESIDEAIRLLEEHQIRHLPVVRDGVPVGMVSQGDVFASVGGISSGDRVSTDDPTVLHAGPTRVEEIMTTNVAALPPDKPLAEAAQLMLDQEIATVVLTENSRIAGIVSERDYLRRFFDGDFIAPESWSLQRAGDHMSEDVRVTSPDKDVYALLREMRGQIHHLPVIENGKLVGVLSDHDVWRALARHRIERIRNPAHEQIRLVENCDARHIMHSDVVTIAPDETLAIAARLMIEKQVGCTPVVEAEKLVGMITKTDILRVCVSALVG